MIAQRQSTTGWDSPSVHGLLGRLTLLRCHFRFERLVQRMRSPRRMIMSLLAFAFFALYLVNGIVILSAREPADPGRLQLWLSGGMVIYSLYHFVRCAWSTRIADLELTAAEELWLGGGPLRRSSLAVYHIGNILIAALLKTFLLAVVLACDVARFELLMLGMFSSFVTLEVVRLTLQRWSAGFSDRSRRLMRITATAIATAVALQVISRVLAATPMGSPTWRYLLGGFTAIGETAASPTVQWLSLPWIASAQLVVSPGYGLLTIGKLVVSIATVPLSILLLVKVDAKARLARDRREQERLAEGNYNTEIETQCMDETVSLTRRRWNTLVDNRLPGSWHDTANLIARQAVSVKRYWGTIVFSFVIPTLLCLSPLATGRISEQWLYVVSGIALCTLLLAPPALRIDFRRDLRRMMLLRSLPVRPLSMVLGQLTLPVMITWAFQWFTIAIAALVTQPGIDQVLLWTGMLSALAVFTFAAENALFLAYPHHEKAEGIGMMIRAKLTFMGKGSVIAASLAMLVVWAVFCKSWLPMELVKYAFVSGAVIVTWIVAGATIMVAAFCWRRFDFSFDVPPE